MADASGTYRTRKNSFHSTATLRGVPGGFHDHNCRGLRPKRHRTTIIAPCWAGTSAGGSAASVATVSSLSAAVPAVPATPPAGLCHHAQITRAHASRGAGSTVGAGGGGGAPGGRGSGAGTWARGRPGPGAAGPGRPAPAGRSPSRRPRTQAAAPRGGLAQWRPRGGRPGTMAAGRAAGVPVLAEPVSRVLVLVPVPAGGTAPSLGPVRVVFAPAGVFD